MTLNPESYPMIFKRKSFHQFRSLKQLPLSPEELAAIRDIWETLVPLFPDIRTAMRILPARDVTCQRGQEYCLLLYSEKKGDYLRNIGYLGEQLDLHLVSRNIGTLWLGVDLPEEPEWNGLDYVIMMAIVKVEDGTKFRKNMFKCKRKPVEDIWQGTPLEGVTNIVRFAPSACNLQPWLVERDGQTLTVCRYSQLGKHGIMPAAKVPYYNQIDIGIFLCFLDLCLAHENIPYTAEQRPDGGSDGEKTPVAVYRLR